jgi:hypothetical protein
MIAGMITGMFVMLFTGLVVALRLVIGVILIRKYSLTRQIGYVWLGVAVVVWPLIVLMLSGAERMLLASYSSGQLNGVYPFSLVQQGQATIGGLVGLFNIFESMIGIILLLVAVLLLGNPPKGETKSAG